MRIDSEKIKLLLAEQGLTQVDIAKRSGLCPQAVCLVLHRGTCTPKTAGKLAKGLGVSAATIIMDNADI